MHRYALLALLILTAGCMRRPPNYVAMPADDLFVRADAAFQAREYSDAVEMLDVFVQQHLGDPRAPRARLMLGQAHVARREYLTAAIHFQRLVNDFPASPLQREARFGICDAYNRLSPEPPLDQEYTQSAILHCESVAQSYPGSEEGERAGEMVVDLREKLARKSFDTGAFYFKRGAYDSAVVYFNEVLALYPTTTYAPRALAQLIATYDEIGYVEEAQEARERLQREYPDSPEARGLRA